MVVPFSTGKGSNAPGGAQPAQNVQEEEEEEPHIHSYNRGCSIRATTASGSCHCKTIPRMFLHAKTFKRWLRYFSMNQRRLGSCRRRISLMFHDGKVDLADLF